MASGKSGESREKGEPRDGDGTEIAARAAIDPDRLKAYSLRLFGYMNGATVSMMVCLGDRLGLYGALAELGEASSEDLARHTGLAERWVREWLYAQGASGLLETRAGERFSLSPEAVAVLVDETHPANGIGMLSQIPDLARTLERLPEAFRTGLGLPYDELGAEGARGIERGLAPWFRSMLVPVAIPRVEGLREKLTRGLRVADVGCGAGVALLELAKAFPASELHGYDISRHALDRAEANREEAGVTNVSFHDASVEPLPADSRFDLVTTFDCLHDMTDPQSVIRAIRQALAGDGVWLVADIKARPSYAENVERNPMAAMMYGISVMVCMSSSLSTPDGAGLGTLGLHAERLEGWSKEAGFTRFEPIDLGHPVNAFYVIRP
jgi:2-polyprenyl-3-methyl-5-hydroxy-6-metoxy-1,4-benzoquinol methylase